MKNTRILFRKLAYGCLLLLCTGCLHENPELTEDGEMGVDPTSVILNANLNINLDFTLLEEADTRATENDIQQRVTIAAFLDGEEVKREVIYQKVVTGRNQLNIPVSMKLHARLYQIVAWVDYENKNDSKGPYYITDNLTSYYVRTVIVPIPIIGMHITPVPNLTYALTGTNGERRYH